MNNINLHSMNVEKTNFDLDFGAEKVGTEEHGVIFKLTGVQLTLSFDHWIEVETSQIEEEWGIGFFEIEDLEF